MIRDAKTQLDRSREIIAEKISNQRELLKRYEKTVDADKLSALQSPGFAHSTNA
ncbi:MAG: hypothetical protein SR1Q7_07730 [Quinella sp. 1Q7]|nr:hypothetical protein [Quinella sp. 1Q7]